MSEPRTDDGERKQVTVLFADVKGSMDLAEQVDPEEWHKIMERFFAILSDGVHRFEGTINQYTAILYAKLAELSDQRPNHVFRFLLV